MLTIIGCGNPNRSDDGAGVRVVRELSFRLGDELPAAVRVLDAGTSGIEVMFQARGSSELIVIDASRSGAEPGAVFTVPGDVVERAPQPALGLHGFRWDHALYAGRRIFGAAFPPRVTVYLIEAETLELGIGLSACVQAAVERVVDLVLCRLTNLSNGGAAFGSTESRASTRVSE
jgi:hydrogenase maturation protease